MLSHIADCTSLVPPPGGKGPPPSGYGLPQSEGPEGPAGVSLCEGSSKAKAISDLENRQMKSWKMMMKYGLSENVSNWIFLRLKILEISATLQNPAILQHGGPQRMPRDPKCRGSSQESLPEGCEPGPQTFWPRTIIFPTVSLQFPKKKSPQDWLHWDAKSPKIFTTTGSVCHIPHPPGHVQKLFTRSEAVLNSLIGDGKCQGLGISTRKWFLGVAALPSDGVSTFRTCSYVHILVGQIENKNLEHPEPMVRFPWKV